MNTSPTNNQNLYLVTGATGNVGRHLVDELLAKGQRVRALTRNPEKANFPETVEIVTGDLNRPKTLAPALEGVTGMHLITIGGESFEPLASAPELVDLAQRSGVKRATVLWSGRQGPVEKAVKASGLEWTILQPQEFMSNMLGWAESIRDKGTVEEAFGNRKTALIHEGDIARVAAAVLTEDGHNGKEYTLTGPEALTLFEAAETIGEVTGRKVQFNELTEEQARERMHQWGIEDEEVEYILSWYRNTPPEGYTVVPTVEYITGSPPRTFRQWAGEHAEQFRSVRKGG